MSVHYSPQTSVIRNVTVGKTPITVNVSSVERGGDNSSHNIKAETTAPPGYMVTPDATSPMGYPSVNPGMVQPPPFPMERSCDIGFAQESTHNAELEGIVHQTFANMALQYQSPHLRKLTGNHIVLPKEDLITIIAYTIGCQPAEVRINRGFHDVGCLEKREKVSIIDSIKVGVKDLYLAYNEKYNLLEDVYHLSLKYCFDPDAGKKPHGIVYC